MEKPHGQEETPKIPWRWRERPSHLRGPGKPSLPGVPTKAPGTGLSHLEALQPRGAPDNSHSRQRHREPEIHGAELSQVSDSRQTIK